MAYTRPSASAADLSWVATTAYTRPSASAANFVPDVGQATGIAPTTAFGTPTGRMDYFQPTTGFTSTAFGRGRVVPGQHVNLFVSTQFGIGSIPTRATTFGAITLFGSPVSGPGYKGVRPIAPTVQFGTAHVLAGKTQSIAPTTTFGTPFTIGAYRQHFSQPPSTRFSMAYYAFDQTLPATGFRPTRYGGHGMYRTQHNIVGVFTDAFGTCTTSFGDPYAQFKQFTAASPRAPAAHFGAPAATRGGQATGFLSGAQGLPNIRTTAHPAGFSAAHFGTPTVRARCGVAAYAVTTRLGAPMRFVVGHRTYGINASNRFGHPAGWSRPRRAATGFASTQFGLAQAKHIHLARHIPPTSTLSSTHLLHRLS